MEEGCGMSRLGKVGWFSLCLSSFLSIHFFDLPMHGFRIGMNFHIPHVFAHTA